MKKNRLILSVLYLFLISLFAYSDAGTGYNEEILGMSKDLKLLAIKQVADDVSGEDDETIVVYDVNEDKQVAIFRVGQQNLQDDKKIAKKNREEAKKCRQYFKENAIDKKYFNQNFKKIKSGKKTILKDIGYLEATSRLYGDYFYITFYNSKNDNYSLIYYRDHEFRDRKPYFEDESFKEKMENFSPTDGVGTIYQSKNDPKLLLIELEYRYHFPMGWDSTASFNIFDLNKMEKGKEPDFYWLNNIGFKYYKEKKYEKALEYFKKSWESNPEFVTSAYNAACTYSLLKKESDAVLYIKKIVELWKNKKNKEALKYLKKIKKDKDFNNIKDNSFVKDIIGSY